MSRLRKAYFISKGSNESDNFDMHNPYRSVWYFLSSMDDLTHSAHFFAYCAHSIAHLLISLPIVYLMLLISLLILIISMLILLIRSFRVSLYSCRFHVNL